MTAEGLIPEKKLEIWFQSRFSSPHIMDIPLLPTIAW
jgi:hypothetical protein